MKAKWAVPLIALGVAVLACGEQSSPTSTPQVMTATPQPVTIVATELVKVPESTALAIGTVMAQLASPAAEATATAQPTEPPATATAAPQSYNLGNIVALGDYYFQAVATEDPATPGLLYQAESGKRLVAVEVIVGNASGDAYTTNPLDAVLIDDQGFAYQPELGARDDQLEMLDVNHGECVEGWIAFKIPQTAKMKSIKYNINSDTYQSGLTAAAGQKPAPLPTRTPPTLSKVGDVVQQDGYSLTSTTVEDPGKPGLLFTPQKGMRLVAIEVVVANISGDKITTNPLDATLVDTDGFLYKPDLGARDGQLQMIDLAQGERCRGPESLV